MNLDKMIETAQKVFFFIAIVIASIGILSAMIKGLF